LVRGNRSKGKTGSDGQIHSNVWREGKGKVDVPVASKRDGKVQGGGR